MGINTINNTSFQEVKSSAVTAVASGDLVVNSERGGIEPVNTLLGVPRSNNTTAGLSAISAISNFIQSGTYQMSANTMIDIATLLGNDNVVFAYGGNGTTGTTNLNVRIINILNAAQIASVTISGSSINSFRVRKVDANSFAVAWLASTTLNFAIYNNDGTVVLSPTTVGTASGTGDTVWNFNVISNGNIVFIWDNATNNLVQRIYNSTGGSVLAETNIEATSSAVYMVVTPQSSGNYVVYYRRSNATTAYKFARYNSSGTIQGSLTTVVTTTTTLSRGYWDKSACVELSNGNILFQASTTGNYPVVYIYTSTGTLVTTSLINLANSTDTNFIPGCYAGICAFPDGWCAAGNRSNATTRFSTYSNTGVPIINLKPGPTTATSNTSGACGVSITYLGAAGFLIVEGTGTFSCGFSGQISAYTLNLSGDQTGSTFTLRASASQSYSGICPVQFSNGSVYIGFQSATIQTGTYLTCRSSVLGVAQTSASAGQTASIGTYGSYQINQNLTTGGAFDQRTATISGSRGSVVGTTANLLGIV